MTIAATLTSDPAPGALAGIRVVDLSTILMGPYGARILADQGAEVIRIESLTGDSARNSLPARNPGMSGLHLALHRNKRSIALNLKDPNGRDAALAIMATADVVISNMRRAALDRLGIGPDQARAEHPELIYCVANGYGSNGPYAAKAAYDDAVQAGSGLAWLQAQVDPSGEPRYLPAIIADKVCGMTVAQAVLVALLHRARTGAGQIIEVPMLETMVAFNVIEHQRGATFDPPAGVFGYDRLLTRFRKPFRTADGWAALLPYSDRQWQDFLTLGGRPDLLTDPRFADHNTRMAHIDELYALVEEVAPSRTTADWLACCEQASIPASPVLDLSKAEQDPHLAAVGLFEAAEHPSEGRYRNVADPVRYGATPSALRRHAPRLGEHTKEILTEAGWDDARIAALLEAGTARQAPCS